ncbi:A/G-specific adenine glycosylase [Lysinibacter sp. HNR]|uniref:A/G-specific adenine glycosylase n=1 Tax=Lysinibacter sp. HNR TaxID=3031408 RepID=UPI0024359515|nr:A/G-specific adenine glycosylase [Lysinibacter sp. HNR]WGD36697.1 A/G-specific adenine glycosylase [Lysinibacter sp. HNR]
MEKWRLINSWFAANRRELPWRGQETSAWAVLVSEFMLQQTPVIRVIPRFLEWMERWPTPAALAAEPAGEALRAWHSLGYPRRALWLHRAATIITEQHGGVVPRDVDTLLTLTGVGDYTARAVAVFAHGDRHPVVDTNTRRVIARAVKGQAEAAPPSTASDLRDMTELMPEDDAEAATFNAAIMELGALVCTARNPLCDTCPLAADCAWKQTGYPEYTGPKKPVQKKYEGSDRQVRGLIMAEARTSTGPVAPERVELLWDDVIQRDRALAGLLKDGLLVERPNGYTLSDGS